VPDRVSDAAAAALQTWGDPLTDSSNAGFGCETQPTLLDSSGNYHPVASNQSDCTWFNRAAARSPVTKTVGISAGRARLTGNVCTEFGVGWKIWDSPGATPIAARAGAGATISFSMSQAADASIAIHKPAAGRRRGAACVAPTRTLRHARNCTRWRTVGTLTRKGLAAGGARVPFPGRIGTKPLRPGRYRAAISARTSGRSSQIVTAAFRIGR
jgi:hypothetical protein